jgi:hypothetical protein
MFGPKPGHFMESVIHKCAPAKAAGIAADSFEVSNLRVASKSVAALMDSVKRSATHAQPWLSIILPVRDEVGSLVELHARLSRVLREHYNGIAAGGDDWEIIFVNDGSTDGSCEALQKIAAADPRVKVLNFRRNFGQTAALAGGIEHAAGEIIVTMDADLQHLPEEIPLLVEQIHEGHEMVVGYRRDRSEDGLIRS